MKIVSSCFGELEVPAENIIKFKTSIPGFEGMHDYFLITSEAIQQDEEALFCWLHSAEDEEIAFALLDVFKVKEDYSPEIDEDCLAEIGYKEGDTIAVYNIVNIPEKIDDMTVNLFAPVVLNITRMLGRQVLLKNEAYSLKHRIFDDVKKATEKNTGKEV